MKLIHVNLTVTDVSAAHKFLEKYFGLQSMGEGNDKMARLFDDNGLALVLMKAGQATEVKYPASFPIGFLQKSEAKVNEINQSLQDDGFDVPPPRRLHGAWVFYFQAPGRFTIEVARLTCAVRKLASEANRLGLTRGLILAIPQPAKRQNLQTAVRIGLFVVSFLPLCSQPIRL